jgi:hypothetical protein
MPVAKAVDHVRRQQGQSVDLTQGGCSPRRGMRGDLARQTPRPLEKPSRPGGQSSLEARQGGHDNSPHPAARPEKQERPEGEICPSASLLGDVHPHREARNAGRGLLDLAGERRSSWQRWPHVEVIEAHGRQRLLQEIRADLLRGT